VSAASTGATGHGVAEELIQAGQDKVRHLARHQVMGLTVQFLLGMAVNLLGQPSEATGTARIASTVFLAGHVLISVAMAIGAVLTVRAAARISGRWRRQANWGAAAIAATLAAGILTVITNSNWWSYGMALGFITALLAYGSVLLKPAPPLPPHPKNQTGN